MFLKLIAFEIRYHLNQIAFRFAAIVFFIFGLLGSGVGIGGPEVYVNSPFTITFVFIVFSMSAPILLALLTGNAILRDSEHRMEPIIYATNLTQFQYLTSRFCGLVITAFIAMLPIILGLITGYVMPGRDSGELGPFPAWPILWSLLMVVLPNILLSAVLVFSTSALTKSAPATYLSGIFVYLLYSFSSMIGNSPLLTSSASENDGWATLMEPYGLTGFLNQTRYWTAEEKNLNLLSLEGPFLFNRLLWLGLALLLFNLTSWRFQFRTEISKRKASKSTTPETLAKEPKAYETVATKPSSQRSQWHAFLWMTRTAVRQLLVSKVFLAFAILWLFFLIGTLSDSLGGNDLGVSLFPSTAILLEPVYAQLIFFGPMVIIFFTAEVLWAERTHLIDPLTDSVPVSNTVFWASKTCALATLILTFLALSLFVTLSFQAIVGPADFQWELYALLALKAGGLMMFLVILAMTIMTFIKQKYGAMAAVFAITAIFTPLLVPQMLGLSHPMLRFGHLPAFQLSSMTGSSIFANASFWYLGYWTAFCGFLSFLTLQFWRRGLTRGQNGWNAPKWTMLSLTAALLGVCGFVIFYQMHVAEPYRSPKTQERWQAAREWTYSSYRDVAQPTYRHVQLWVDLYPSQRQYELKAELTLENHHREPLREVLLSLSPEVREVDLQLQGGTCFKEDRNFGQYLFRFQAPLEPGDTRVLSFSGRVHQSAFKELNPENYLVEKTAYIELEQVLPQLGYASHLELQDASKRKKYGLPQLRDIPPESHAHAEKHGRVTFEIVASSENGQQIVAPGSLVSTWQEQTRPHFKFIATRPVPMALNLASGEYQTQSASFEDIQITYYHHPRQAANADLILKTAVATLAYGTQHFGPYGGKDLKIAALPSFAYKFAGTACPDTVYLVEDRAVLLNPSPKDIQATARIVAHEIAHQWWGMQINPAEVEGVTMLLETLAVYTEMVVTEQLFGKGETQKYLRHIQDQYFFIRNFEAGREKPLAAVDAQPSIYYYKGGHVVHALRDLVGEAQLNHILRALLSQAPYPKTVVAENFVKPLREAVPENQRALITELLREVVTYDLKLQSATSQPIANGLIEIHCDISAQRIRLQENGKTLAEPLASSLNIALLKGKKRLAMETVYLDQEQQTVRIQAPAGVDTLVLDPTRLRLDALRGDNRITLEDSP